MIDRFWIRCPAVVTPKGDRGRPRTTLSDEEGMGVQTFPVRVERLSARGRPPGHRRRIAGRWGGTADIDRPLSFEAMADDIAVLIKQEGTGPADVIRFSGVGASH